MTSFRTDPSPHRGPAVSLLRLPRRSRPRRGPATTPPSVAEAVRWVGLAEQELRRWLSGAEVAMHFAMAPRADAAGLSWTDGALRVAGQARQFEQIRGLLLAHAPPSRRWLGRHHAALRAACRAALELGRESREETARADDSRPPCERWLPARLDLLLESLRAACQGPAPRPWLRWADTRPMLIAPGTVPGRRPDAQQPLADRYPARVGAALGLAWGASGLLLCVAAPHLPTVAFIGLAVLVGLGALVLLAAGGYALWCDVREVRQAAASAARETALVPLKLALTLMVRAVETERGALCAGQHMRQRYDEPLEESHVAARCAYLAAQAQAGRQLLAAMALDAGRFVIGAKRMDAICQLCAEITEAIHVQGELAPALASTYARPEELPELLQRHVDFLLPEE